jgi:hypothetical protein
MQLSSEMIDHFIAMTHRVIERDGFEAYQPTLLLPQRKDIRILEGVPADVDIEAAATSWATRATDAEEDFFLAFKTDPNHFKVIARVRGERHEALCPVQAA